MKEFRICVQAKCERCDGKGYIEIEDKYEGDCDYCNSKGVRQFTISLEELQRALDHPLHLQGPGYYNDH